MIRQKSRRKIIDSMALLRHEDVSGSTSPFPKACGFGHVSPRHLPFNAKIEM